MPNLLSSLNTALRGMLAQQSVIQTIEHNVANANTPGYRRQEAMLRATVPYPPATLYTGIIAGQMGTGTEVDYIRRFSLDFFDGRFRRELGESKRWAQESQILQQVEATLSEAGSDGLVAKLDKFWAGWQALSDDPANMTLRSDLRERTVGLAEGLNWRAKSLLAIRKDQDSSIIQSVGEINNLATQVARLNVEISNISAAGDRPNDLLDERSRLINRLAEITGATSSTQENGDVIVSVGGHTLVVGSTAFKLQAQAAGTSDAYGQRLVDITWEADNRPLDITRGELYGLLNVRDNVIPQQMDGLNQVAFEVATQVNNLHSTGYGLNNTNGHLVFANFITNDYALEIRLHDDMADLSNIAVAQAADSPADGSLAVTLANFRTQPFMNGGTMSINEFYTQQIGDLALTLNTATSKAKDRNIVVESLAQLEESMAGVSLDEEAANLVKAQRIYQASARMMTAVDQMLDTVINGMGVVGR